MLSSYTNQVSSSGRRGYEYIDYIDDSSKPFFNPVIKHGVVSMSNVKLPRALCAVVGDVLYGSHATLDELYKSAGAPGDPPDMPHSTKWKEWLVRAGNDPEVDSLAVLGNVLEEFMDLPPNEFSEDYDKWQLNRNRVVETLEEYGLRYYRAGQVLPVDGSSWLESNQETFTSTSANLDKSKPSSVNELLEVLIKGLPRAMHPLVNRRKGAEQLSFETEYDIQDLLHAMMRPWISDIRAEEYTPSYAGSSTRMDFLLPRYSIVIELKFIRDKQHGKKVGDEIIIDIEHYRSHEKCKELWCVIYDPSNLISNQEGLRADLMGERKTSGGEVEVKMFIISM